MTDSRRVGRHWTTLLKRADYRGDFRAVNDFLFEQPFGKCVEQRDVVGQDELGGRV